MTSYDRENILQMAWLALEVKKDMRKKYGRKSKKKSKKSLFFGIILIITILGMLWILF